MAVIKENEETVVIVCNKCKLDYNSKFHKSCPYCTPGIINPLRK